MKKVGIQSKCMLFHTCLQSAVTVYEIRGIPVSRRYQFFSCDTKSVKNGIHSRYQVFEGKKTKPKQMPASPLPLPSLAPPHEPNTSHQHSTMKCLHVHSSSTTVPQVLYPKVIDKKRWQSPIVFISLTKIFYS
jgi:hypothetical protein